MYKVLRRFFFLFDPEKVHYFSMNSLRILCSITPVKKLISYIYNPGENNTFTFHELKFPNRVGLAAGFDKNAMYLNELEVLGFGSIEIGTVTPLPQHGNEKPRLFRLPADKGLINRMGFNNDGVEVIAKRLKTWQVLQSDHQKKISPKGGQRVIIGGNIGKNKSTKNEDAWRDYETCFLALHDCVDYFVVNVSSPNTPGLRKLQDKESLSKILKNLQALNAQQRMPKPILLKIAPDLTSGQVDDVIDLSLEINLDGLIVSNTSIARENLLTPASVVQATGVGGLSGLPVRNTSTNLIRYISSKTNNKLLIIGSGGIFTKEDAVEKINAGASLVQVWTGFIYEGPAIVKNICKGL